MSGVGHKATSAGATAQSASGLRSPLQAFVDLLTQEAEIDGLGKQSRGPEFGRSLSRRFVPIGGNHDDGNVWPFLLHFGSISSPVMPGMLMSDSIKISDG